MGVVLVGMLGGAEGWDEIETIAEGKRDRRARWLALRVGVPSADTLQRVFRLLRPDAFGACLAAWIGLARRVEGQWMQSEMLYRVEPNATRANQRAAGRLQ